MTLQRREFIAAVGGATAWPLAAQAQQAGVRVVGFLYPGAPEPVANRVAAFRRGLSEAGYVDGRNLAIEFRWALNDVARLPELAADLVRQRVAVIVASPADAIVAARAATTTIPVVFYTGTDPVQAGYVASLNRPGANVTGVTALNVELAAKRLGLLHELLPGARRVGLLVYPTGPNVDVVTRDVEAAAALMGLQVGVLTAGTSSDINMAFASLAQKRVDALLLNAHPLFINRRVQLVTLAARYQVPVIYYAREFTDIGGLMSYGTNIADQYRQVGIYAARILKGRSRRTCPSCRRASSSSSSTCKPPKSLASRFPRPCLRKQTR